MRREDLKNRKLVKGLRSVASGQGPDWIAWFRARPDVQDSRLILKLEHEDGEHGPEWMDVFHELYILRMCEQEAAEHHIGPGSRVLLKMERPIYSRDYWGEDDVECSWDVLYAVPHHALKEAWDRSKKRFAAWQEEDAAAKLAQEAARWRQPYLMQVNLHYHDGTTFEGCGDGPPRVSEDLRGYTARLMYKGKEPGIHTVTAEAWLAYGKHRKTVEEAISSLGEKLAAEGRKIDLSKLPRIASSAW